MADGGVIVEVGVAAGDGVRALWSGTQRGRGLRIYAVDPFLPYTDLNGAHYGPDTGQAFAAMLAANPSVAKDVVHVPTDGIAAARQWPGLPVALLWVDMTDPAANLLPIVNAWQDHIAPGGYVAVYNLEYEFRGCGARLAAQSLLDSGGWRMVDIDGQDGAAVLQKALPRRAVFYIVHGDRYLSEAAASAASVRRYMRTADTVILCHAGAVVPGQWGRVLPVLKRTHRTWYCDSVAFTGQAMDLLSDYDELLYLDSDTTLAWPCDDAWAVLQQADMAFGHSADRDNIQSIYGAPAAFTTPMIGVNFWRNDAKAREFVRCWLSLYEQHETFYGEQDQAPLRDLLWKNEMGMRYVVLPPEFACRHNFGCWLKGMARIMHGRLELMDKTLDQAAAEINGDHTMRLYHPRFGMLWSVAREQGGRM